MAVAVIVIKIFGTKDSPSATNTIKHGVDLNECFLSSEGGLLRNFVQDFRTQSIRFWCQIFYIWCGSKVILMLTVILKFRG